MWVQVGPFFNELTEDASYLGKANAQHRAILEAARAGDAGAVRRHLALDIAVAADHIVAWVKRPAADPGGRPGPVEAGAGTRDLVSAGRRTR